MLSVADTQVANCDYIGQLDKNREDEGEQPCMQHP